MYTDCFHSIVRRCLLVGCTGSNQKSVLNINLCRKGILPTLKDFGDSVIHHHICEATQVFRDTIIGTVKFGIE